MACILLIQFAAKAQMKIGNNPTSINSASLLELETTNKGLVFPRISLSGVTSSSPLASGLLAGTVVYNTNASVTGGNGTGLYVWSGSAWTWLTTNINSLSWSLTGNAGTSPSTNFIGTTDNTGFRLRTNNIQRILVDSLGDVAIGSSAFNSYLKERLLVDYGTTTSNNVAAFKGSIDDYFQVGVQNTSNGTYASSDFVATANDGTDSTYYIDMGINGANYAPGVENWGGPHDGYLYVSGRHLIMGTQGSNSDVIFLLGGGKIRNNAVLRLNGADGNVIVGTGETSTSPIGNIIRGPNANGTNIAGGSLSLKGGNATGTATGGSLNIYGGGTVSGTLGAVNINANTNSATNINTGTSTGDVTIGNSSNNINLPKLSASSLVLTDASKNLTASTPSNNTHFYYNGTNFTWYNATQTTATLNTFTSALKGLAPASGGGTTNYLRADGTWSAPVGSGGTVTSVSFVDDNGFEGTITNPTTTPQITIGTDVTGILEGDGSGMFAATPGIDYTDGTSSLATGILKSTTGTGNISIAVASDFPTLNQNTTGNAATVTTNANLTGPVTSVGNATSVTTNAITNTMLAQIATQTFKGRTSSGTGNVEDLTVAQAKTLLGITGTNTGDQTITLTGDVTGSGTASFATTIAGNAVTNAKLAQIATQTFKGRTSAGTGNVEDLTIAQTKTLLNLTGTNSGDQTITLTGDVTGSGTSSFASTISAGAVTYSKIQNVTATNKVLGRTSTGAGVIEEISTTGTGNVVRANSPALVTPTGIVKSDVGLGNVDNTSDLNKPVSTATQTALDLKIDLTQKGANNGVATLDAGGKVPSSQLPVGSQVYKGTWNASTNTPTLADGTGTAGWTYRVVVAGTVNLGSGSITFSVGDDVIYSGTVWQRNPSSSAVISVNSQTGAVVLTTDNISEGSTNKYYTDTRVRSSVSATAPLAYNSSTGVFSIPQATTSANGYLSSADWNTFNGKQAAGNYITALTGDVTATGPGSVTATIANNAVTYAKMQAMTSNKLLGSGASGTAVSEITLGTGLSFTGSTLNASSSGGSVTTVSVASANGFAGTVANATSTPAITLSTTITGILKGNGTAMSAAIASDFPTLNQNTTGNAATVTTNANLTGPVTSVGNATSVTVNAITNAMLAQIPTQTFKGRTSAGTGNVEDLTATQATAMLNTFTTSAQGMVPASGGGTTNFLRADGTFAAPSGTNYRNLVSLGSDVINSSAVANTLADVTGLSFTVTAGTTYHFYALIPYTSAITTTGSRWTINAPTTTLLNYTSRYTLTATSQTINFASAVSIPAASNASSLTAGNVAILEGVIKPSANGTVQIRFASEVANSAITAKAGATLEWW